MDKLEKFLKAAWDYIKQAKIELIVLFAALAVDLITKALVAANIPLGGSVTVIPNFLYFTYIHNYAAAFGSRFGLDKLFGETGTTVFFIVLTFVAIGFFAYFMYRNRGKSLVYRLSFALIIGGAIGNLVDRMASRSCISVLLFSVRRRLRFLTLRTRLCAWAWRCSSFTTSLFIKNRKKTRVCLPTV